MNLMFPETNDIGVLQVTKTTNAAATSAYMSIKAGMPVQVLVHLKQAVGHATVISIYEDNDVAGTSGAVITETFEWWLVADLSTSDEKVRQTAAATFTVDSDATDKLLLINIFPKQLSATTTAIAIHNTASSQTTDFLTAFVVTNNTYKSQTPPTMLAD